MTNQERINLTYAAVAKQQTVVDLAEAAYKASGTWENYDALEQAHTELHDLKEYSQRVRFQLAD